ncbi:MAG TPA: DUF6655 family protein [Gemmataceae bacterium]|nr:DUF6655 family protein [Gemmataceae bacterium]
MRLLISDHPCRLFCLVAPSVALALGCGTTRLTDTARTATEQLLVSNAIDQAVSELDFRTLAGKTVFFDPQYLDGTVDRGYLISSIRQQLLASGCLLQEDRTKATYIVEARTGSVGTDRHALLVGVPQMTVPTFVPGQPSNIPEIPFAKKTDQEAVAKVAVFAYNRVTGQPIWQSGVVKAMSTSKDMWLLGAGPFQRGTIRQGTEFAGEPILPGGGEKAGTSPTEPPAMSVTQEAVWLDPVTTKTDSKRLAYLLGAVPVSERPVKPDSTTDSFTIAVHGTSAKPATAPAAPAAKPPAPPPAPPPPPPGPESEPSKVLTSANSMQPALQTETEPGSVMDTRMGYVPDH